MTLKTRSAPTFPLPLHAPQAVCPADGRFGVLVLEAVMPAGEQHLPDLPDWDLRLWPVARLGDVTLEARPLRPHLGPDELRAALRSEGWTPLGPVRQKPSSVGT